MKNRRYGTVYENCGLPSVYGLKNTPRSYGILSVMKILADSACLVQVSVYRVGIALLKNTVILRHLPQGRLCYGAEQSVTHSTNRLSQPNIPLLWECK